MHPRIHGHINILLFDDVFRSLRWRQQTRGGMNGCHIVMCIRYIIRIIWSVFDRTKNCAQAQCSWRRVLCTVRLLQATGRAGSVSRQTPCVVLPNAPATVKHPPNTDSVRRRPATVVVAIVAAAAAPSPPHHHSCSTPAHRLLSPLPSHRCH